jgi:hypothetical protein
MQKAGCWCEEERKSKQRRKVDYKFTAKLHIETKKNFVRERKTDYILLEY